MATATKAPPSPVDVEALAKRVVARDLAKQQSRRRTFIGLARDFLAGKKSMKKDSDVDEIVSALDGGDPAEFGKILERMRQRQADSDILAGLPQLQAEADELQREYDAKAAAIEAHLKSENRAQAERLVVLTEVRAKISVGESAKNRMVDNFDDPVVLSEEKQIGDRLQELQSAIVEKRGRIKMQIANPLRARQRELEAAQRDGSQTQRDELQKSIAAITARLTAANAEVAGLEAEQRKLRDRQTELGQLRYQVLPA